MINKLGIEIHKNSKVKGFYDDKFNMGEKISLIHSEVSEALEADRKEVYASTNLRTKPEWWIEALADKNFSQSLNNDSIFKAQFENLVKDTFEDELADIMIRVMDLAAFKGIDLESHVKSKIRYNSLREHKHGKKY